MKLGPLEIHWHRRDAEALTRERIRSAVRNELAHRDLAEKIDVTKAQASTEFAGTGATVNIYGVPTDSAAAIGDAVDWVARTHLHVERERIHVIQRSADATERTRLSTPACRMAEIVIVIEPDGRARIEKQRNDDYEVTYEKQ